MGQYSNEALNLTTNVSLYGEQVVYVESNVSSQALCVEVKHPGQISHHDPTPPDFDEWQQDATRVNIILRDQHCSVPTCSQTEYSSKLKSVDVGSASISFLLEDVDFYGNSFGVYCVKGQTTPADAQTAALYQCMTESNAIVTNPSYLPTQAGSLYGAVEFDCNPGNLRRRYMSHSQCRG